MIESLDVMLWSKKAGTLVATKKRYGNQVCFYFDPEFVRNGYDIAPLRSPIGSIAAQRGLPVYPETDRLFGGLPSFIADSMPDHWGNIVFSEWAKSQNIRSKDLSALDRLAYIGRRGMGALEFVPPTSERLEAPFKVQVAELSNLARTALQRAKEFHAVLSPDFAVESLFKVGTSAGGRRPKAVINLNVESGECYSGQVEAPYSGFTPMIIKFDEHNGIPTTRIEYSYYLMALDCGMTMMPSLLFAGEHETHFLTQRFDRKDGRKIHVQTLAALSPTAASYEDLFRSAAAIGIIPEELQMLFLQMVMNVFGGNIDDHNKNFSFLMDKDGVWHISPAYDYTFTVDPDAPFYINRHSMSIGGKTENITLEDILTIARTFSIKGAKNVVDLAVDVLSNYRSYAEKAGVDDLWAAKIDQEITSRIHTAKI